VFVVCFVCLVPSVMHAVTRKVGVNVLQAAALSKSAAAAASADVGPNRQCSTSSKPAPRGRVSAAAETWIRPSHAAHPASWPTVPHSAINNSEVSAATRKQRAVGSNTQLLQQRWQQQHQHHCSVGSNTRQQQLFGTQPRHVIIRRRRRRRRRRRMMD